MVLPFLGAQHETPAPTPANPNQIHGFPPQTNPIPVPTNPANATGNKGRRIGQFVFMRSNDLRGYTDLLLDAFESHE